MWIVRLALRRPYTFVVMSILILILGGLAIVRTPTDIFPNIDIPVVSIIWNYNGLVPQEIERPYRHPPRSEILRPPSTISSTSSRNRSMELPLLKCSCSRPRTFNRVLHRLPLFLRPSSGNCLLDRRRHSFLPIAHRVCPSSSWPSRDKICPS